MLSAREDKAFFILLRSGLWNTPIDDHGPFPLTGEEWLNIYAESCRHAVQGIVFDGLKKLVPGKSPDRLLLAKWLLAVRAIENRNVCMNRTIYTMKTCFEEQGLHPVLLKGQANAMMYKNPLRRSSGDIDLCFVSDEEFLSAMSIMCKSDWKSKYDSDGDVHFSFNGILVEFHKTWIQCSRPSCVRYLDHLFDDQPLDHLSNGVSILSPLLNLVMLNQHILKHALVLGVGWRQLCDLAVAYSHYQDKYDKATLRNLLTELHLRRWTKMLEKVLVDFLGMPQDFCTFENADNISIHPLVKVIDCSGDMGLHVGKRDYTNLSGYRRWTYLFRRIFNKLIFSLQYAPGEFCCRLFFLAKNRIVNAAE